MLKSANMANRRNQRPTFEGSRGVRYHNIANRRDERPTFVKNSRLASTVCYYAFSPDGLPDGSGDRTAEGVLPLGREGNPSKSEEIATPAAEDGRGCKRQFL